MRIRVASTRASAHSTRWATSRWLISSEKKSTGVPDMADVRGEAEREGRLAHRRADRRRRRGSRAGAPRGARRDRVAGRHPGDRLAPVVQLLEPVEARDRAGRGARRCCRPTGAGRRRRPSPRPGRSRPPRRRAARSRSRRSLAPRRSAGEEANSPRRSRVAPRVEIAGVFDCSDPSIAAPPISSSVPARLELLGDGDGVGRFSLRRRAAWIAPKICAVRRLIEVAGRTALDRDGDRVAWRATSPREATPRPQGCAAGRARRPPEPRFDAGVVGPLRAACNMVGSHCTRRLRIERRTSLG